ncbi:alpha-mannosidase [Lactiplantibacillus nangangensis]|uniref:Alpha-mannosidase n=1 Tax=Lactiplantibacillus nangangensis TaxID=2559917 RepID=A0ABW1SGF3_9LACO|nr:alpha-mannosidase [Lactiplantibacillus nangangensis]
MTKKKVFIISHSHWDREWYMPFEQHHMRLVTLVDNLLDIFKNDPDFDSFHLDGQMIALDDYLEVRPERKPEVAAAIRAGKLRIGPFYILQDDFLISPESNVRNMIVGRDEAKKYGQAVPLGYFPDTFGNMGQTPQMMALANLKTAAFGRGVTPTGFNNQTGDADYESQYSEMWWQGPDGSKILGLLFANWYSNGNEIPVDPAQAKVFWDQKLADAEKFASTGDLLMMNGVDHQPVQLNVTKAIKVANQLYPDYEFIHTNFTDYLKTLSEDLPKDLSTINGELTSQETDGWYTLANTASSRVYLKQTNTKTERLLENQAEPLATMAYPAKDYPHDRLRYAWKLLLQNHPHDSICGCSVDEVHREMMTRFAKSSEVGRFVAQDALTLLASRVKTTDFDASAKPFVVVNTAGYTKSGITEATIEWDRRNFSEAGTIQEQRAELEAELAALPELAVVDHNGQAVPFRIVNQEIGFHYDLPKDSFRIAYQAIEITVALNITGLPAFAWEAFGLQAKSVAAKAIEVAPTTPSNDHELSNEWVKATLEADGSLTVTNRETGKTYHQMMVFEDTGDMGNEYIYRQTADNHAILSTDFPMETELVHDDALGTELKVINHLQIPVSADETLIKEEKAIIDITQRTAKRSAELQPLDITTTITLGRHSKQLQFETKLNNQMRDHRVRVLFKTGLVTETNEADSIYETVTRPNHPAKTWQNPTNPQHQQAFVNLHDAENGVTVGNLGLNEYEILPEDGTIAVTLIRSVGELGDWGYFATPEAQTQGEFTFDYNLELHDGTEAQRLASYHDAQTFQVPFSVQTTAHHAGDLAPAGQYVQLDTPAFAVTSLKRANDSDGVTLRGYNLGQAETPLVVNFKGETPQVVNFFEEPLTDKAVDTLAPAEIKTLLFKDAEVK